MITIAGYESKMVGDKQQIRLVVLESYEVISPLFDTQEECREWVSKQENKSHFPEYVKKDCE
jgi:hypothetical protein